MVNRKLILVIVLIIAIILAALGFILISLATLIILYFILRNKHHTEESIRNMSIKKAVNEFYKIKKRLNSNNYNYVRHDERIILKVARSTELDEQTRKDAREQALLLVSKLDDVASKMIAEKILKREYDPRILPIIETYSTAIGFLKSEISYKDEIFSYTVAYNKKNVISIPENEKLKEYSKKLMDAKEYPGDLEDIKQLLADNFLDKYIINDQLKALETLYGTNKS